jgi:ribose transport system permease protein
MSIKDSPKAGSNGSQAGGAWLSSPAVQQLRFRMAANALVLGVVALFVVFSLVSDNFLSVDNLTNVSVQISVLAVVAVPTALLLIAGKVDLSVGSNLALCAVTSGLLMTHGTPIILAILAGIATGAVVGAANGAMVTYLDLSPIIVTLGALTAVRGLALTVAPTPVFDFPGAFVSLGGGELTGIPNLTLVAILALLVGTVILGFMPIGRHLYAIGVNPEAAYLSGVRVKRIGFLMFVFTGAAAGLAGVMLAARLGSAPSGSLGVGFELEVLTAVILGGVAFNGGRGTMLGVLLGVVFLGVLQNGLTLENVPAATALMIKGGTLVVAAYLDRVTVRSEAVSMLLGSKKDGERDSTEPPGSETSQDKVEDPR